MYATVWEDSAMPGSGSARGRSRPPSPVIARSGSGSQLGVSARIGRGLWLLLALATTACASTSGSTAGVADAAATAASFDRRWLAVVVVILVLTPLLLLQHRRNQRSQRRRHRREQILTDLAWLLDDVGPPPDASQAEVYATDVRSRGDRVVAGLAELATQGPEPVTDAARHLSSRVERLTEVLLARLEGPNDPKILAARAEDLCRQTREGESALRRALDTAR